MIHGESFAVGQSLFSFYGLLPDAGHRRVLLLPAHGGWALPRFMLPHEVGALNVTYVNAAVWEQFGAQVTTLYSVRCPVPSPPGYVQFSVLENHSPGWAPPQEGRWIGPEALPGLPLADPLQRPVLETWFTQFARSDPAADPLVPWWEPGWLAQAEAWIAAWLRRIGSARVGLVEQRRSWYRSAVLRVNTEAGHLYFKAATQPFSHEAALTQFLARWKPEHFPPVVAVDPQRCWMLTRDMGELALEDICEVSEVATWEEALRAYARLQIASVGHARALLRLPVRDLRWKKMALEIEAFVTQAPWLLEDSPDALTDAEMEALRSLVPELQTLCERAEHCGIPCTLVHGDFGASNVQITGEGFGFFDWSDGGVSHPFFDLATFLGDQEVIFQTPGVIEHLRDVYLREWRGFAPLEQCRGLYALLECLWPFHQEHRNLLATWRQKLGPRRLLPYTGAEWSVRSEQGALASDLRNLLKFVPTLLG